MASLAPDEADAVRQRSLRRTSSEVERATTALSSPRRLDPGDRSIDQLERRHLPLTNELGLADRIEHHELIHQPPSLR